MVVYDCVEALENVIKIEHEYLSKFNFENFNKKKDYKTLEKMINLYGKNLPYKKGVLNICCEKYNLKIIKMLIEKCDITVDTNHLFYACKRGSKKIVKYLLQYFDKSEENKEIAYVVCNIKNYKIAKIILDKFGNKLKINEKIVNLAYLNNKKIFELFVKVYKEKLTINEYFLVYIFSTRDTKLIRLLEENLKEKVNEIIYSESDNERED